MRSETVYLAEYDSLMFQFAVSADPFEKYPETVQLAPGKHKALSTLWGEIKAKMKSGC